MPQPTERLRDWLRGAALPLWIDRGFDSVTGGFHERLDFDANPIQTASRRSMVQARQILVYARAIMLGWSNDARKVTSAFDALISRYHQADGEPGFIFSIDRSGAVSDAGRDSYGHAFVLLAMAAYHTLTGDSQAVALADKTLAFMDEAMAAPRGGYVDRVPNPPSGLRQNPHMHLFEALLALFEATGKPAYLARAGEVYGLLKTRFFQPASGTLAEYYDNDWNPIDGGNARWEPGHHMEWIWLLAEYGGLAGIDTSGISDRLMDSAYRHGVAAPAFFFDEVRGDGRVMKKSCRAWPLTEAIKAQAVRIGKDRSAKDRMDAAANFLFDRHLTGVMPGLWRDHLSEGGECLPDYVPASTLYHVAMSVFVAEAALKPA
jgi:mannose-6-phosphate isomerase